MNPPAVPRAAVPRPHHRPMNNLPPSRLASYFRRPRPQPAAPALFLLSRSKATAPSTTRPLIACW